MNDPVDTTKHSWLEQLGKRRDLVKTVVSAGGDMAGHLLW